MGLLEYLKVVVSVVRSSPPAEFLEKGFLNIYSKFTEQPCRSVLSIMHAKLF